MKNYRYLLFDLDDTLLDFGAAEKMALPKVFEYNNFPLTEEVEKVYKEINGGLWQALEQGLVTREQLMETRFAKTFEHFGLKVDGKALDTQYRDLLVESKVFVEGAFEVIEKLSTQFDLYITSNGISDTQFKRLNVTNLRQYFKDVFVSEDTGYQKPMKPFFDYVFDHIPNFNPEEAMIIGDSYSADITGGYNANIDTCWLNPKRKPTPGMIRPTYEIQKLNELLPILNVEVNLY